MGKLMLGQVKQLVQLGVTRFPGPGPDSPSIPMPSMNASMV